MKASKRRITDNSQNLREYGRSNQTSGILGTLGEMRLECFALWYHYFGNSLKGDH